MSPTTYSRPDLSPELVLVDPELRRVAQLLLPEPGALVEAACAEAATRRAQNAPQLVRAPARSRRGVWAGRAAAGSIAAAAGLVAWSATVSPAGPRPTHVPAGPATVLAPSSVAAPERDPRRALPVRSEQTASAPKKIGRQGPARKVTRPKAQTTPAPTAPPTTDPSPKAAPPQRARAPRVTRVSPSRPTLSWKAVRDSSYYNVILWRGGERVLDLWPSTNRAILPRTWHYGGKKRTLSPGQYLWFVYPGFGAKADASYGDAVRTGILVVDRK